MQPLRIRLRSVKRVMGLNEKRTKAKAGAKGGSAEMAQRPDVKISDGQDPSRWARVRLREEVFDSKKYAVIEVLEVSAGTQVAFITPDIYL